MKNNLCIIPARGGSKRIPRKNIKNFLGIPIIAYSINAAIKSNLFSEIMVSTDDPEIAQLSIEYGANVPFLRSEKNSNDISTTLDVIKEVINEYKNSGREFDNLCCIYPTAPFVSPEKLNESFDVLNINDFDSVFPIMKYSYPIQRSLSLMQDNGIIYKFPEFKNSRSQDLEPVYHDSGQFYWCNIKIIDKDSIVTEKTGSIVINELEGQDIDTEMDWKLAELKYELIQSIK